MSGNYPDLLNSFISDLLTQIQLTNHRRCVVIAGDEDRRQEIANKFLDQITNQDSDKNIRWVSTNPPANSTAIDTAKIHNILGDETDVIVFDACSGFNPDTFGAVSGILRGGGLLLLLTPKLSEWSQFNDPEYKRITVYPTPPEKMTGRFLERLVKVIQDHHETIILDQEQLEKEKWLPTLPDPISKEILSYENPVYKTIDQQKAVAAIIKVSKGHRRRPLVITSDRGRGKSAALGIAAAQLMKDGVDHIIITAPRLDATNITFDHASKLLSIVKTSRGRLKTEHSTLEFLPPDELIRNDHKAKLLLVDEAAAIPAPILEKLLIKYSRIVFVTTIHGYEGTGRGFAVRFLATLNKHTPDWKSLEMKTPIRWADNDPLEDLVFKTLLLNANAAPDELVTEADTHNCSVELVDRQQLLSDESTLKQLFGLLVNAHYQTRPSDLRYLLDGPNLSIFVMRHNDQIIGTSLLCHEGGFEEEMANEITSGKRRPHGHLIPETLASHLGLKQAPLLSGTRVVRIAIHSAVQNHGLGSHLLDQIQKHPTMSDLDYLASCFGATEDLLRFWKKSDYLPIRIGVQRNASSGEHSVVVFKPISEKGKELFNIARERFFRQFPHQLADSLQDLEPDLAAFLLKTDQNVRADLDEMDWEDIKAFVQNERIYEACLAPIRDLMLAVLMDKDNADQIKKSQKDLLIRKVLQNHSWQETARLTGYSGKKSILENLRKALLPFLDQ